VRKIKERGSAGARKRERKSAKFKAQKRARKRQREELRQRARKRKREAQKKARAQLCSILEHVSTGRCSFFELFWAHLASKFPKKAVIRPSPQKNNSTGLSKNAKLYADFKSIEEVAKKSFKKVIHKVVEN
jgi:hypothetical protein